MCVQRAGGPSRRLCCQETKQPRKVKRRRCLFLAQTWSVHINHLLEQPEVGVLLGTTALLLGIVARSYQVTGRSPGRTGDGRRLTTSSGNFPGPMLF